MKQNLLVLILTITSLVVKAQSFEWISSTQGNTWKQSTIKLSKKSSTEPIVSVTGNESIVTFKAWGTCFNELGWDALNLLYGSQQDTILSKLFSNNGDLRFTMGRFSMNANDYARDWYSCDEVDGDFQLKYFNIDRDKTTLIPYIKAAMKYNPKLTFWISPWSPPSWMKINHYYSVLSNKDYNKLDPKLDYLLFEDKHNKNDKVFPKRLAVNDYLIQDPRYLKTYANYFCKFISAYKEIGIPITMVMFQNEAWSYTPYPGCAWTPKGVIRFNTEYLAPIMKELHPNVDIYLGTINTNRFDFIDEVLSDPRMTKSIKGVGFQWEGGQILPKLREKYPQYRYVQTESECGWGSFDWKAAEHTFQLINHYLGNGCEEYTFWNAILSDNGVSGWGWNQNSLIRIDSKTRTATYMPEYYAVKHYTHYISPKTKIIATNNDKSSQLSTMIAINPQGKFIVLAGNFNEESKELTIKLGEKYLNVSLPSHSLNTFEMR
ncbi:beta-glycosidase [Labilibaculum manganireducens]|uniref:Beta-glycosidase n=1 Tax=Labilibaculum manganireducens TaxID=1940525 RepID=A0A2N3HRW8_9BACT|nr:glycoside hydrolase family 30 beta sandwich domain-containing protein [Labilibaculum manganireducens]PKQ60811.1 beta-glycosidase [Labilibaculum manganireducens]